MSDLIVNVHTLVSDEGTVVVFQGTDTETGDTVTFAADHRPAGDLAEALFFHGQDLSGPAVPVVAQVPEWAVLSRQAAS